MSPVVTRGIFLTTALALSTVTGMLGWSGCAAKQGTGARCTLDSQCGSALCMNGTCLPRGAERTGAVEILPRADSTAARTGIPDVALGPGRISLAADDSVVVAGTVTNAPNSHVVLLVANPIPGQADLQFETDLADFKFQISVGRRLIRSMATIWLIPTVDAQQHPPVPFVAILDQALTFTFPPAAQMTALGGILHDSLDMPAVQFQARALVAGNIVSNVAATDDAGAFQLLIAPGAIPTDPSTMITVEFTPPDPESGPRFDTTPFPLGAPGANNAKIRTFRMPPFVEPAPLGFAVQAATAMGSAVPDVTPLPVPDVTMRFRTEIPSADGVAIYEREQRTDGKGEVQVKLIPGTATDPQNYTVTILPPPDSPYSARCVANSAVTNVGSDMQLQYSATFYLDAKVILKGTILGSGYSPAPTTSVSATLLPVTSPCGDALAISPVSSTTLRNGTYEMLVDPGTYRLDIDPPMGSELPRLTEDQDRAVVVSTDYVTTHDVTLPAGEVIEGDVIGMDATPLGSASIKVFEVLCQADNCDGPARVPPALRAQTRTDLDGHFRAVLPLSP